MAPSNGTSSALGAQSKVSGNKVAPMYELMLCPNKENWERGDYHTQVYLSFIQHKNLTPYEFVINSPQMTSSTLIRSLQS